MSSGPITCYIGFRFAGFGYRYDFSDFPGCRKVCNLQAGFVNIEKTIGFLGRFLSLSVVILSDSSALLLRRCLIMLRIVLGEQ